jgi:DNA-directed RNA polymerase specialized sigma24 family protein
MKGRNNTPHSSVTAAIEAIDNLAARELDRIFDGGQMDAMIAHDEIKLAPINRKSVIFYRHFVPLRDNLIFLLANSYRQYFKVALAHRREAGTSPEQWAWNHLQSAVGLTMEWIHDWYILACDGTNQYVQPIGTIEYRAGQTVSLPVPLTASPSPPPESWRAPAWLFQVSIALVGVGPLKTKHVPETDSEQELGAAHTRLLLKGARRVFLWALEAAIERVRNEETAAAGAIPAEPVGGERRAPKTHQPKGVEGLVRKTIDLSRYMDNLTEKQRLAFSLKFEYELGLAEIASRMGLDRKTAYEHIEAAQRKIDQANSNEKHKARNKSTPE